MNEPAELWYRFAQEDLRAAEILFREEMYNQVCFHSQQATEKALKAVIVKLLGTSPPRVHALTDLLRMIPPRYFSTVRSAIIGFLDVFYLPVRYPDALPGMAPDGLPGGKEAEEALELARTAMGETAQILAIHT
jgi:HEPN domain-containing protein